MDNIINGRKRFKDNRIYNMLGYSNQNFKQYFKKSTPNCTHPTLAHLVEHLTVVVYDN
jgi:hypothetical protein